MFQVIPLPEGLSRPFIANNEFSNEEETEMTKKTTAKKNATKAYNRYEDVKRHEIIRDELMPSLKRARKTVEVTNCIPGKGEANLTNDPDELKLLKKVAAKFGWSEFCTVSQAAKKGVELDPEYKGHGWLVAWLPTVAKSGRNAGKEYTFRTVVYPKEAFVWPDEPAKPEPVVEATEPEPVDDKDAVIAELTAKVDALLAAQIEQQKTNELLAQMLAAITKVA